MDCCCICFDEIGKDIDKEKLLSLPCGHKICSECIQGCMTFICPMCRIHFEKTVSDDIKSIIENNKKRDLIKKAIRGCIIFIKSFMISFDIRIECIPPTISLNFDDPDIVETCVNQIFKYALDEDFFIEDTSIRKLICSDEKSNIKMEEEYIL